MTSNTGPTWTLIIIINMCVHQIGYLRGSSRNTRLRVTTRVWMSIHYKQIIQPNYQQFVLRVPLLNATPGS